MRTILAAGSERMRSNAIETLATLAHRRFVLPLLPLLDPAESFAEGMAVAGADARLLSNDAWSSTDGWVRAGALVAMHTADGHQAFPADAAQDAHPVTAGTGALPGRRRAEAV